MRVPGQAARAGSDLCAEVKGFGSGEGVVAEREGEVLLDQPIGALCQLQHQDHRSEVVALENRIGRDEVVAVVSTATGLKDTNATASHAREIPTVSGDIGQFLETLKDVYGYRQEGV